ncbi:MAG TPA: DUF4982 domain-containing protein [Verrucomicrobia bacterium]|nr:DUF4982 domain-containing protein [Verrucomicrobiota bacterium]HOP97059.1 glycoside hydrolase family 2 TIM barrel-domain containing protein [Verrucomicrobiota bacterium]HPU54798.1 glycoside hydrolase family 2 TIM barrel-domain containing protein [Verrucomicrobiota bacterium]
MKRLLASLIVLVAVAIAHSAESRVRESFDFDWRFHLGDAPGASSPDFLDIRWRRLDLPHDFSAEGEFSRTNASGTGYLPGGIAWYRKAFVIPAAWKGKRVSIEFDGVSMNSEVWINGQYLGKRPSPYASFAYDLTRHLRIGGTNVLAVRVDHSQIADSRWYVGSGIYRHVWLVATDPIHVPRHGIQILTPEVSLKKAVVEIRTSILNATPERERVRLNTELIGPDGRRVGQAGSTERILAGATMVFTQKVEIVNPSLWSPDNPALYRAVTTVRAGRMNDELETTFGIRSIRFHGQAGFFLNELPVKFKGLCMHHDGGIVGAAVPDKVLERRLRIAKEMGCNAIRTAHNPMAPEFYDLCDRIGLMVMDEAFDEWTLPKRKWIAGWNQGTPALHGPAEYFEMWGEADLREMILRDRNHPSIVLWSIGNEIDYRNDPFSHPEDGSDYDPKRPSAEILPKVAARLIQVVRECDDSRPITAALANIRASNATGLADLLDVVGYNYQVADYERDFATYPQRKFLGSETSQALNAYEISQHPRVAGQFLWVGWDFLGEGSAWPARGSTSGVFDTCGFLKPRAYIREALWSEKPAVRIAVRGPGGGRRGGGGRFAPLENHWNWQNDTRTNLPVEVYSNCDTVELFLNGRSLGRKTFQEATNSTFHWTVPFEPGELKAVATRRQQSITRSLITAGAPARIELIPDRTSIAADGRDVAHIEVQLVDANGVLVPDGNVECSVRVVGEGRLLGVDNGDQRDMTPLRSSSRKLNHGRALALVQSSKRAGKIQVIVSAPELPVARLYLDAE